MRGWTADLQVYLAVGATDLRKSIQGLSILVEDLLEENPFSGHLFGFCNRQRDLIKVLYWDRNGFSLWMKRLEKDKFAWPTSSQTLVRVGQREFQWLLDGLELHQERAHSALPYDTLV